MYDQLYLVPDACNWEKHKEQALSVDIWMMQKRAEIVAEMGLPVVATIATSNEFFVGANTGFKIRVPDYLCLYPVHRPIV